MTDTDVAFLLCCRSCPCDRHDLYLPFIPASLQTLGRCECAAASALAPHGLCTDTSVTLDDAATLNDATRNDATHNALPTPPTTHTPERST
jgi:hypothetical protein